MGRKAEYCTKTKNNEITADEVKEKIGKEVISAKEIAIYLNEYTQRECTYDEKTIKNYIVGICEASKGLLSISDFKKNPSKPKSKYEIKPEYQGFLLTLIDTAYFDGRKNDRILATREQIYRELLINLETFLDEIDLKTVKANPAYINARVESTLSEKLNNMIISLVREVFHSDQVIRYTILQHTIEEITRIYQWVTKTNSMMLSTKLVYVHELDELSDAVYQKGIFAAETLEEYLISLLAFRMHGKNYTYIDDEEELRPVALYLASRLYNIETRTDSEANKMIEEIEKQINNISKYDEIKDKAEKILNLNNPIESVMYRELMKLCKCYFIAPYVEKKDYEKAVRFTESAIADDKWDLLNKFVSGDINSATERDLLKLEKVKNRLKTKE